MKLVRPVLAVFLAFGFVAASFAQNPPNISSLDRERARAMLRAIADDVRKHYYDPTLHGVDFDARIREADAKIQAAPTLGQAFTTIAWALESLNDSHTYFIPPMRTNRTEYGWRMQMVGDRCFVTQVRPKSDAEAKGLRIGDEILMVNNLVPARDQFHVLLYLYNVLRPQVGLKLKVRGTDGQVRELAVMSSIRQGKTIIDLASGADLWEFVRDLERGDHDSRWRCVEFGEELIVCKFPVFNLDESGVHNFVSRIKKHKNLVLDLRGNPGGSVETLQNLVGGFFDHPVTIGERVGRKEQKPLVAKPLPRDTFTGKAVVLVDHGSASAAELFARTMQLQKRATVVGDVSSGLVMEAKSYTYHSGDESRVFYGVLITDANIVMPDGKSLEHTGGAPDRLMVPSQADLAGGLDTVLTDAASVLGLKLSPEQAGKLFPYEWPYQ